MRLSVLVVSRSAERLSGMLGSLSAATRLPAEQLEILCSWNGSSEAEAEINNPSRYEFLIAQREPYHFAKNMNQLASNANGDLLAFVNDDILLDTNCLDAGMSCLSEAPSTLLVGAMLRKLDGQLQHAGMGFDLNHTPYHVAEGLISASDASSDSLPYEVPAVTGALMLIPRKIFMQTQFNEGYERCGEDVQFNLDIRQNLQGSIMLCPRMSAIHIESATRAEKGEKGNTSEDIVKMRTRRRLFLEQASAAQLQIELQLAARERQLTQKARDQLIQETIKLKNNSSGGELNALCRERDHWQRQAQLLQIETLRLQDTVRRQVGE